MTLHRLPKLDPTVAAGLIAPYSSWANRVAIAKFVQDIPRSPNDATWKLLAEIENQLHRFEDRSVKLVWGMHGLVLPTGMPLSIPEVAPTRSNDRADGCWSLRDGRSSG